jgi:hypothetical protein
MRRMWMIGAAVVLAGAAAFAATGIPVEISVKTMPPSVVKTVPQAGDTAVDPDLTEVRATFSKDMLTKQNWSWCRQSVETFPKIDKTKIRFLDDKRTCVLPVTLEPEKTYVIWINTQKYNFFKDTNKTPAIPYLLVFQTGKKKAKSPTAAEETAAEAAAREWLKTVDSGGYATSWDGAAAYFKTAITKGNWMKALEAARKPLGNNLSRKATSRQYRTSLPGAPDGKYVVIQFASSFEHKAQAVETVTPMMEKDGKWRVSGYFIK